MIEFLVDGTAGMPAGRIGGWLARRRAARRGIDATAGGLFIGPGCAARGGAMSLFAP